MIPYTRQSIDNSDIKKVVKTLKSNYLTQGSTVEKFEKSVCEYTNCKYSVAVNSATSALHLACLALGLKKNDYLWTVPNSFVASANCALHCNAKIDFVDIDINNFNISVRYLETKLKLAKKTGKLPKILVPVHLGGQPTYQEKICKLSKKYGFRILEDASHSIGAIRNGNKVGNCRWSDITIFSFHAVKIITTAEGGMALTNSNYLYQQLQLLRSHGITRDKKKFLNSYKNPWNYEQQLLGFNFRMNEIQAALGMSQLNKIEKFIKKRNNIAKKYIEILKDLPIDFQRIEKGNYSSYHLFIIKLKISNEKINQSTLYNYLKKNKIESNLHYFPIHLQPFYQKLGFNKKSFLNSEIYAFNSLSIPIYYTLSSANQNKVIKTIREFFKYNLILKT